MTTESDQYFHSYWQWCWPGGLSVVVLKDSWLRTKLLTFNAVILTTSWICDSCSVLSELIFYYLL